MVKAELSFNEILPFVAMWMDRGNAVLSQITQTEEKNKTKHCMTSLIHGIQKISKCIWQNGNTLTAR